MLSFGVTVLPDPPYTRLVEVLQNAEKEGFEYGWTYDSHILWQESYDVGGPAFPSSSFDDPSVRPRLVVTYVS